MPPGIEWSEGAREVLRSFAERAWARGPRESGQEAVFEIRVDQVACEARVLVEFGSAGEDGRRDGWMVANLTLAGTDPGFLPLSVIARGTDGRCWANGQARWLASAEPGALLDGEPAFKEAARLLRATSGHARARAALEERSRIDQAAGGAPTSGPSKGRRAL